ncbi:Nn.00g107580.m01.CDS01 [Neocucurbitaria sp. VM-36]
MIGYNSQDPFKWFGLHKRIVQFNARLNALVDQLATEHGYRIMTVHTSATTREHLDGDLLLPNTRGYLRIALDFVEHMATAALMGWFSPGSRRAPNGAGSIGIGSQSPARPSDNDTLVVDKVTCNQEFEFLAGQGMPTKEDALKSILRGASMDDFITKVACNADEICKWAVDGVHGDKTDFPSANGTVCITAGGAPNKADYNQLIVVRPDASYDLGRGSCKDAVQSILNDCILSGQYYGGYFRGKDGLYIEQTNLDNGFAIPNIANNVVQSALDGPAPTTTTFKPSLPFATVTGIYV